MNIYTRFASSFVFPLHEYLKRHNSVAVHRRLEASQWWEAAEIRDYQRQRLQVFMKDIAANVPYYQKMLTDAGISAKQFDDPSTLERLPFLTKSLIRENGESLKALDSAGLVRMNTGGSTGEPMVFMVGKERISHDVGAKWRATRWWGVDIGDPEYVIWGSPIELGKQDQIKLWRDRLLRTRLFSAFAMSNEWIDELLESIVRHPPRMLFGYPSALALIAEQAKRRGVVVNDLGIKVAFVTAEKCYDHQKAAIEQVFGCAVANGYGGRDSGFIAHECSAGALHLSAEDIIVEIVDPDGQVVPVGHSGEIVVTHMSTRDFPFVRYRTGDVGTLSAARCECGRGLPILKEVSGRSTDFIRATDGTLMHGLALIYVVRDLEGIKSFKIVQESRDEVLVLLVPDTNYSDDVANAVISGFRDRLGQAMNVRIDCVDDIQPERSGKYRYVVNNMDIAAQSSAACENVADA